MRKTMRELGVNQGWEIEYLDREGWKWIGARHGWRANTSEDCSALTTS